MDNQTEVFEIKGFEAFGDSDKIEGKGHRVHIGYFKNEDDAKDAVKGQGVMGRDGYVQPVNTKIVIYGNMDKFRAAIKEDIRVKALAKLSPAEKEALGL